MKIRQDGDEKEDQALETEMKIRQDGDEDEDQAGRR